MQRHSSWLIVLALLAVNPTVIVSAQGNQVANKQVASKPPAPQNYSGPEASIEFTVAPANSNSPGLMAGTDAVVRFKIVETKTGKPLTSLRPSAWLDLRDGPQLLTATECREKVRGFLSGSLAKTPTVDLNSYFILVLNKEPNISVIDPLIGLGSSKLRSLISLPGPGQDWIMSQDKKRLFVSMPTIGKVSMLETGSWKILSTIEASAHPGRLILSNDGKYLWIANNSDNAADGGVTVIDTATSKVAAQILTGLGRHEIVFDDNSTFAFVTNKTDGTLAIIDARRLTLVKQIKVGARPTGVAYSSLTKSAYVVSDGEKEIVAVGAQGLAVSRIAVPSGLQAIRIVPNGKFAFALNPAGNSVYVVDLVNGRIAHSLEIGPGAAQVTFSKEFAYVRSSSSEYVTLVQLSSLDQKPVLSRVPAGQKAPGQTENSLADAIVNAPDAGSVLIANAADKAIYYYVEGMVAPMGTFQNYRRDPLALLVLDNSLRETAPGEYASTIQLPGAGQYDVPVLLDAPRVVTCFRLTVNENPELPLVAGVPIKIEPQWPQASISAGKPVTLRFKVTDSSTQNPKLKLSDLRVLVFLAPGVWQQRMIATEVGAGVYEMIFTPPEPGQYHMFFESASLSVTFKQMNPLTLDVVKP
jgi:YVTN family beta-propeller protein